MTPIVSVCVGLVLGFLGVGLPTLRTIWTMEGRFILVFFVCLFCTANLFIFTNLVVTKNYYFMAANAIGAALSVTLIAWRRRNVKIKLQTEVVV